MTTCSRRATMYFGKKTTSKQRVFTKKTTLGAFKHSFLKWAAQTK